MKQLLLLVALFIVSSVTAQCRDCENKVYFSVAQDFKMSYEGPHGNGGVLNPEFTLGFAIHNQARFWLGYEWLKQISYHKSAFGVDYYVHLTDWLNLKVGPELFIITRHMDNPNYMYKYVMHNWGVGVNGEVEVELTDQFSLFANLNVFEAEPTDNMGNPMKDIRWDVRVGVILYLFAP